MFILAKSLTIGQVTLIFRIVIQTLAFGGTFLIGAIIFGNSPRSASKETHDLLNRIAGKSTATVTSVRWMKKQMFKSQKSGAGDHKAPKSLLFGLLLSMLYGLFISLSDIGFLGLHTCSVPFPPFDTFPASIRTEADARALVQKNLVSGTDPKLVKFHQCDSANNGPFDSNSNMSITPQICSKWHNTTYDDPSRFRSLNLTDSDVLMHKVLGVYNTTALFYQFGHSDRVVLEPTISDGLAVLPHETGVQLVVGAPNLSKNQVVNIPKTMALEISVGCLPVGLVGINGPPAHQELTLVEYEWFIPDSIYRPLQRSKYSGPENLFRPLQTAANAVRALVQPNFNTSIVNPDTGYIRHFNATPPYMSDGDEFGWSTIAYVWSLKPADRRRFILNDCAAQVLKAVNVSILAEPDNHFGPLTCVFYGIKGSWAHNGGIYKAHDNMVCATMTAVNMVSANLEMDMKGRVNGQLSRLPSDLNINVYQPVTDWPDIRRYTLSDNPSGDLQHYIYQYFDGSRDFVTGTGSPAYSLPQIGLAIGILYGSSDASFIDSTFFSWNQFNATTLTKWVGGFGASWMLPSFAMNGWAALDKPLTIRSTGGRPAVCYSLPYLAAFIPLISAALAVILWNIMLWISSRLRDAKKWEEMYGGLVPSAMRLGTLSSDTILVWEDDDVDTQLRPLEDSSEFEGEI